MSGERTDDIDGDGLEHRDDAVHRTVHDGSGSFSVSVVEALAAAEGVSPVEVRQPLYDVVDPDALDRLFTDTDASAYVTFELADYEVTAHASGEILVRDRSTD